MKKVERTLDLAAVLHGAVRERRDHLRIDAETSQLGCDAPPTSSLRKAAANEHLRISAVVHEPATLGTRKGLVDGCGFKALSRKSTSQRFARLLAMAGEPLDFAEGPLLLALRAILASFRGRETCACPLSDASSPSSGNERADTAGSRLRSLPPSPAARPLLSIAAI